MTKSSSEPTRGTVTRFPSRRYTTVAIILHWLIALAVLMLLASGFWMSEMLEEPGTRAFGARVAQWHKALGLTVLVFSLARLGWRLSHRPPPLPGSMGRIQRIAASTSHIAFYVLMIGMPIIGWAMVSASPTGIETTIFGLFQWPRLPFPATVSGRASAEAVLKSLHASGASVFAALIVLHVAAALKHHVLDRDGVLTRILPAMPSTATSLGSGHAKSNGRMPVGSAARSAKGGRSGAVSGRTNRMPPWVLPAAALVFAAALATLLGG